MVIVPERLGEDAGRRAIVLEHPGQRRQGGVGRPRHPPLHRDVAKQRLIGAGLELEEGDERPGVDADHGVRRAVAEGFIALRDHAGQQG